MRLSKRRAKNKEMELGAELGGDFGEPEATEYWAVGDEPKGSKVMLAIV